MLVTLKNPTQPFMLGFVDQTIIPQFIECEPLNSLIKLLRGSHPTINVHYELCSPTITSQYLLCACSITIIKGLFMITEMAQYVTDT